MDWEKLILQNNEELKKYKKRERNIIGLRIVIAVAFFSNLFFSAYTAFYPLLFSLLVLFLFLLRLSQEVNNKLSFLRAKDTVLQHELQRSKDCFDGLSEGDSFVNDRHPFSTNLNVFGENALFQRMNRSHTCMGQKALSEILIENEANLQIIQQRQACVIELQKKHIWGLRLQVLGLNIAPTIKDTTNINENQKVKQAQKLNIKALFFSWFLFFLSIVCFVFNYYPIAFSCIVLTLVANQLLLRKAYKTLSIFSKDLRNNIHNLTALLPVITHIKDEKFESEILQKTYQILFSVESNIYVETKKLIHIKNVLILSNVKIFGSQGNLFYMLLNQFAAIDYWMIYVLDKWRKRNTHKIVNWLEAAGTFEMFNSIAFFNIQNAEYSSFPKISEEAYFFKSEKMGHPLIDRNKVVCYDFELYKKGSINIVTGSNMSGKSTFLRAIGSNLVLAKIGAKVFAQSFECSTCYIFTSFDNTDDINEGKSTFYAELVRIKELLDIIKEGKQVLFLLDELFKGTNSSDRIDGSFELIKKLTKLNCFGLITTHDIELAEKVENFNNIDFSCFNSQIQDGRIHFSYELEKGICRQRCGTQLMKNLGLI